jgi:hypothetical protein
MSFVLSEAVEIEAPSGLVWAVITDLASYGEWNPFVVECRSTLEVGASIDMRVQIFEAFVQQQRETILEHISGERLCYGLPSMPFGSLASQRSHEVEPLSNGRTHYHSHFQLDGWLAPVTQAMLGGRLERGFASMTGAIKDRAEALQAERIQSSGD